MILKYLLCLMGLIRSLIVRFLSWIIRDMAKICPPASWAETVLVLGVLKLSSGQFQDKTKLGQKIGTILGQDNIRTTN